MTMTNVRVVHTDTTPWNEMCIWCLENVGLPNDDTWQYHPTADHMDFKFATEQDAIWFSLLWLDSA